MSARQSRRENLPKNTAIQEAKPKTNRNRKKKNGNLLFSMLMMVCLTVIFYATGYILTDTESEILMPVYSEKHIAETTRTVSETSKSFSRTAAETSKNVEEKIDHYTRKKSFYTILLAGVDDGNGGSDTNILVAVDADNKYIYGVSIPRDCKAEFKEGFHKINAAYNKGGIELLSEVVSTQLGIPIDYTVKIGLNGFTEVVNLLGGVKFTIPIDMDYDDPLQDLHIHFSAGEQLLNGEDALRVVRFRHNNDGSGYGSEDLGRISVQQDFLKALAKQALTPRILLKIDDLARMFKTYVETNLTTGNLVWLGAEVIGMGIDRINFSTLPGEWKSPYIYLDKDAVLKLVNTYLNPYIEDRLPQDLQIPGKN